MDRDRFEGLQRSFHECSIQQIMMLIVMLVDEVQWRIREFRWQEIAPENSESGNQTPPAVAVGQNQVENDGSTASGSDPENPPAARRGPVQPSGPPPNLTPAPWKRFRRGGWTLLADLLIPSDGYQFLWRVLKKKTLAQARHRRDCPACAKFTCLATGGETGYWWVVALHIYIYQCRLIFRQAYDVGNMFEPMFFNVERCFPYIFLHCSLIFRQAFPGAVTRHGVVYLFACNALVLHYTYNLINAVRFSDGLGLQNRSRYEAGCCESTAMVGTLQQLQTFWRSANALTA